MATSTRAATHSGAIRMMEGALRAAGMKDSAGRWIGEHGIYSDAQFLASPEAQEMALTDYLNDIERQLRANGAMAFVGKQIDGRRASFHNHARRLDRRRSPRRRSAYQGIPGRRRIKSLFNPRP